MKPFYLSVLLLLFCASCYVYKPLEPTVDEEGIEVPVPPIENQLEKDRLYKIVVAQDSAKIKTYKIQFTDLQQDTIIGKLNANEERIKKFNINDVQEVKHRKFKPWYSNGLTIVTYAGIAIALILLL